MRIEQNLQVINAILQKNFNPELLEKYSGFGGIGKELAEYGYYKKLNSVISKKEIAEIKATSKTAYYTPEFLVKFIYQALDKLYSLGFEHGFYDDLIKSQDYLIPSEYEDLRNS